MRNGYSSCVFPLSFSLSFIYSSNKNTPSWSLNLSTRNFVDFERDSWLARDWEKPRRELVNSYSRIDDRSVGMRSQRHVSHLAELLRFPFDRPRRLCVTKNRVFTCTSWPTSPSKRSLLRAFFVARKRDPPRQRFPSRGSGHWQKNRRITFPRRESCWACRAERKRFPSQNSGARLGIWADD